MSSLPTPGRLITFAVLLPAAVAGSNQLLFEIAPEFRGSRFWLYPWMALSTAMLCWCVGRYLSPGWLRWIVFGWVLVLLDCLTIAACLSGPVERHVGYVLVAAQISLIVLWAVLASVGWQWRMPVVLVASAVVTLFSGSFYQGYWWRTSNWDFLMLFTAAVMLLLCGAIRLCGFRLAKEPRGPVETSDLARRKRRQFGLKHMMIWATALVPFLLVARGLNFLVLKQLGGPDLFPLLIVALVIAAVNLMAIWSVLGLGLAIVRSTALLAIPFLLGIGLSRYMAFVEATYSTVRSRYTAYSNLWYESLVNGIADTSDSWITWLWLNATLLAALLLFLRASGYRLIKTRS